MARARDYRRSGALQLWPVVWLVSALCCLLLFDDAPRLAAILAGSMACTEAGRMRLARHAGSIEIPSGMKRGVIMSIEGQPWQVVDYDPPKKAPGRKGGAVVRARLWNPVTNVVVDKTLQSGQEYEEIKPNVRDASFSYYDEEGNAYNFYDANNLEELSLRASVVGEKAAWLKEGMEVRVQEVQGTFCNFEFKSDIVSEIIDVLKNDGGRKDDCRITLDNGIQLTAPYYLQLGEKIIINPKTYQFEKRL